MSAVDRSSSDSLPSHDASKRFTAARMPIEEPIGDLDDAVRKLKQCSSTELRRARDHHRRALESLRKGGYNALSDSTREHLIPRLRRNLEALNRALNAASSDSGESASTGASEADSAPSSGLRAFFEALW